LKRRVTLKSFDAKYDQFGEFPRAAFIHPTWC